MQLVIFPGDPYVYATHDDGQDVAGRYGAKTFTPPDAAPYERPAAEIVQWPPDQPIPVDDDGRLLDPRGAAPPRR